MNSMQDINIKNSKIKVFSTFIEL